MPFITHLNELAQRRAQLYKDYGINDPELNKLLLKHQEQLEELKQLLSACDAAEEKIRYAESEEGKNQATAVLLPLLEKFNIRPESAPKENCVSFAPEVTEKEIVSPVEEKEEEQGNFFPTISAELFSTVPSYLKNRMKLEDINLILTTMDSYLSEKQTLIKKPLKMLKKVDQNRVLMWREQDTSMCNGQIWMTEAEIKPKLSDKHKAMVKNVLPILRHLQLTKEVRDKKVVLICPYF